MFNKDEILSSELFKKANIPARNQSNLLQKLKNLWQLNKLGGLIQIKILDVWQLQLLSGHNLDYYKKYADKIDGNGINVAFYAAWSGNIKAIKLLDLNNELVTVKRIYFPDGSVDLGILHFAILSKNISMVNWIFTHHGYNHLEKNADANFFLKLFISYQGWFKGLRWVYEHMPEFFREDMYFLYAIIGWYPLETLDWLKKTDYQILLKRETYGLTFAHMAALESSPRTLDWILKHLPALLGDTDNDYKLSVTACAAISGDRKTLEWCYWYNPASFSELDASGSSLANYALYSADPAHFNYCLSLSNTPEKVSHIRALGRLPYISDDADIIYILHVALKKNHYLQDVSFEKSLLDVEEEEEIQRKLDRNKYIIFSYQCFQKQATDVLLAFNHTKSTANVLFKELIFEILEKLFTLYLPQRKKYALDKLFFEQVKAFKPVESERVYLNNRCNLF